MSDVGTNGASWWWEVHASRNCPPSSQCTIVNEYPLYDEEADQHVNEYKFLDVPINNLNFPSKEVYTSTAEVSLIIQRSDWSIF